MPNRILREGFLDSDALAQAGELAEVLFTRLMLVADDFGRFDGRLSVICRRCWPLGLSTDPNEDEVGIRLAALTAQQLVLRYVVDGKPFIYIPKFKQRTRASKSKFPDPPTASPQDSSPLTAARQANDGPTAAAGPAAAHVVRSSPFVNSVSVSGDGKADSKTRGKSRGEERTEQVKAEAREAERTALPPTAPLPAAAAKFVPRKRETDPEAETPTHARIEPEWWESLRGWQTRGLEHGLMPKADEPFTEFQAKVAAKAGDGPWLQGLPPPVLERVEYYRAAGS